MPERLETPEFVRLLLACSEKEQRFVLNLLNDPEGNKTRAYERAGFRARGESASANATKCLKKDRVRAALAAGRADRAETVQLDAPRVLNELDALAHSCITDYVIDDDGTVKLAAGAPPNAMRAVRSIKRRTFIDKQGNVTGRIVELTLWDKPKSLDLEGSHLALWKQNIEMSGPPTPLFMLAPGDAPDLSGWANRSER